MEERIVKPYGDISCHPLGGMLSPVLSTCLWCHSWCIKRLSSHLPGHGSTRIFHSAEDLQLHSLDEIEMPNALDFEEAQSQNNISFDGVAKSKTEITSRSFQSANSMRGAHVKRQTRCDSFQTRLVGEKQFLCS